jgi:phytol kinase
MSNQILYAVGFLLAYLGVIALMELLHRRYDIGAEITRKIAHTSATISSLLFLLAFDSYWYVLILGIIFFVIFYIGRRYNILKSLESVGRKTSGTYLLPLSVFIVFLISQKLDNQMFFILPILIVGISDPLAGYFGYAYQHKTQKIILLGLAFDKTILGSMVFLASSFIVSLLVLIAFGFSGQTLLISTILVTITSTFVEMISERGFDNLTVPLAVMALLYFL